jgi:hypothetical protein
LPAPFKTSNRRSAQQTETARFWLMTGPQAYHPLARQMVLERRLSLIDSAHRTGRDASLVESR